MRILIVVLFCSAAFAQPTPRPAHPDVLASVEQISADSIHSYIARLDAFYTRHTYSDTTSDSVGIGAALRWVEQKARSFDNNSRFSFEYFPWSRFWQGQERTRHILICRVAGRAAADRARYIVGGHLDSRTVQSTDLGRAPGADDNASSCAALLELLRVLPDTIEHDLEVIWFTGEEQGLWGSQDYAQYLADHEARVDGAIAMDMISHITTSAGLVDSVSCRLYAQGINSQGGYASVSRNWQRWFRWAGESYVQDFAMVIFPSTDRPGRGSDHISFSEVGYPALRVIERNEDLAYQHTPNDLTEFTFPTYARKVAIVTFGALINALQSPTRPSPPQLTLDDGIRAEISDEVVLPTGGAFHLAIREQYHSDYDTIIVLGVQREFHWQSGEQGHRYAFSVARSDAGGFVSPLSAEALEDYVVSARDPGPVAVTRTSMLTTPNPFNDEIRLEVDLARAGEVRLAIYDVLGREVTELANEVHDAGPLTRFWEAHDAATGLYFVRLETRFETLTEKILLMK